MDNVNTYCYLAAAWKPVNWERSTAALKTVKPAMKMLHMHANVQSITDTSSSRTCEHSWPDEAHASSAMPRLSGCTR